MAINGYVDGLDARGIIGWVRATGGDTADIVVELRTWDGKVRRSGTVGLPRPGTTELHGFRMDLGEDEPVADLIVGRLQVVARSGAASLTLPIYKPFAEAVFRPARVSHAQTGQDVLADFLLRRNEKIPASRDYVGTYVDVGACYPISDSNTYFFYERGWRGLCLDANPEAASAFGLKRPRDVFVAEAVGDEAGILPFYVYQNPQWNSFDPARAERLADTLKAKIEVPVRPLRDILATHGFSGKIDLLSIDTEGFELRVLRSLDLSRNRPSLIILESFASLTNARADPPVSYLLDNGYQLAAATGHDAFLLEA